MLIKEITIFGSVLFCSIIATKLDAWNMIILYWLVRIGVEMMWGDA